MLDLSWQNIIHSNTINFLFLAVVLCWLCIPRIKKAIDNLTDRTAETIKNSIELRKSALNNLEDVKADYARTPEETEDIKNTAMNTLNSLAEKAKEDTERAKKILIENTEKSIKNEISKLTSELTKETAKNSLNSALDDIQGRLQRDETLHDKLIEKSIEDLDVA